MASAPVPTPASASMLEVQHQIRANAADLQGYFSDLYSWEKAISREDASRKKSGKSGGASSVPPPRARQSAVISDSDGPAKGEEAATADAHTYDKGYKRWEKFDVEAALREADENSRASGHEEHGEGRKTSTRSQARAARVKAAKQPASPKDPAPSDAKSRAEIEKEEGNAHYKRGDYVAAIKSYTRCLGLDAHNAVVLSNRAMALLKNREFGRAEDDCSLALKADPVHVKSLLRRGTARNALGKHRLALLDFERSVALDPKNRQAQTQLAATRELMRAAIKRAPERTAFEICVVGEPAAATSDKAVKLEILEEGEDKENSPAQLESTQEKDASGEKQQPRELAKTASASRRDVPVVASAGTSHRRASGVQLPSLPKKAPATSYEFARVWKSLAPKGDAARKAQLLDLRARYLWMVQPSSLRAVFKSAIESDLLCEMFGVFRQAVLAGDSPSRANAEFVLRFALELTRVPRFSMTVMFLSDKEKQDMQWVADALVSALGDAEADAQAIVQLKRAYELS